MVRVMPWLSVILRRPSRRAVVVLALLSAATLAPHGASAAISANLVRFPSGYPTVTASAIEEYGATYAASKAVDGSTSTSWAPTGYAAGDWWRGTWQTPVTVDRVKIYPRTAACDNFGFGRIRFSDGSSVAFDVTGHTPSTPVTVDFAAKVVPRQDSWTLLA